MNDFLGSGIMPGEWDWMKKPTIDPNQLNASIGLGLLNQKPQQQALPQPINQLQQGVDFNKLYQMLMQQYGLLR